MKKHQRGIEMAIMKRKSGWLEGCARSEEEREGRMRACRGASRDGDEISTQEGRETLRNKCCVAKHKRYIKMQKSRRIGSEELIIKLKPLCGAEEEESEIWKISSSYEE